MNQYSSMLINIWKKHWSSTECNWVEDFITKNRLAAPPLFEDMNIERWFNFWWSIWWCVALHFSSPNIMLHRNKPNGPTCAHQPCYWTELAPLAWVWAISLQTIPIHLCFECHNCTHLHLFLLQLIPCMQYHHCEKAAHQAPFKSFLLI